MTGRANGLKILACTLWAASMLVPVAAGADDQRAQVNYMLHCQGCHLPAAEGLGDQVPRMSNFVGYFTHSDAGRRFLIQVPGSATAPVSDEQLAELMNWILKTFSADQLSPGFQPYTVDEVTRLRRRPEPSPAETRQLILADLISANPAISGKGNAQ